MRFSPSTGGFYDPLIGWGQIPTDSVAITDDVYANMMVGQAAGQVIIPGENGAPQLVAAPPPHHVWSGAAFVPVPATAAMVDAERDRRLRGIAVFGTRSFQVDELSLIRISGAGSLALGAMIAGAAVGNLRWHGGPTDFTWTDADNTPVVMDAQTMFAFAQTIALREAAHVLAARTLKDLTPIPADFAADSYWPA